MKRNSFVLALILAAIMLVAIVGVAVYSQIKSTALPKSTKPPVIPRQDESKVHLTFNHSDPSVFFQEVTANIDGRNALTNMVAYDSVHCRWNIFEVAAKKGPHGLIVSNNKIKTSAEKEFNLSRETWFYIVSWRDPIRIEQRDEPYMCE